MEAKELLRVLHTAERLKDETRHCYTSGGRRESVAEHSWRLALMALLVADEFPDVDCGRVVRMCLVHDLGEAFTGDIPAFEKRRQDETHEAALLARWVETLPEPLRAEWRSLYAEMEALATPEARLYKALDKLEAVIQHNEADIATWLPLEYDLNIAYGADEVVGAFTIRAMETHGSKRPPTKSAGRKSPQRRSRCPTTRGNSRSSPTECAALCTAVCRVSAKVVRFGRPSACTNVLRNHSEPFLWRFLQAAGLPPFGTKRWCQKHPPGETAGDRPSSAPKTLRSKLAPAFSQGGVRGALSRNRDY